VVAENRKGGSTMRGSKTTVEAGIALTGDRGKSIANGKTTIAES